QANRLLLVRALQRRRGVPTIDQGDGLVGLRDLMKKPVRVISANVLERIAEQESRFNLDYLAYPNRKITWAELVARLPHVAMIGDSVCTGMYVSSVLST